MMGYTDFCRLMMAAQECESLEHYLAEVGGSVEEQDVAMLGDIYSLGHEGLSIRRIAEAACISLRRMAMTYGLPTRTVENWASGDRTPPEWQLPLIAYAVISDKAARHG